jgi:hypothetical protein
VGAAVAASSRLWKPRSAASHTWLSRPPKRAFAPSSGGRTLHSDRRHSISNHVRWLKALGMSFHAVPQDRGGAPKTKAVGEGESDSFAIRSGRNDAVALADRPRPPVGGDGRAQGGGPAERDSADGNGHGRTLRGCNNPVHTWLSKSVIATTDKTNTQRPWRTATGIQGKREGAWHG